MDGIYLRCDGTLTVDVNGYPTCDSWSSITTSQILGDALQQHKLSADDFAQLGSLTVVILLAAFGVKMVVRQFLTNSHGD